MEGDRWGQNRLEIDTKGPAQSYMLHVVQARGGDGTNVKATLNESADAFEVTLEHPKGKAVVSFGKGMTSTGGRFGFAASGNPQLQDLTAAVQGIRANQEGVRWE